MESESDPLTHRPVDLFEKEPLKGKWEVNLHTPTKFGEDPSKDLGGDREHTNTHTHTQTNKRCSNYSMMISLCLIITANSHLEIVALGSDHDLNAGHKLHGDDVWPVLTLAMSGTHQRPLLVNFTSSWSLIAWIDCLDCLDGICKSDGITIVIIHAVNDIDNMSLGLSG